MVICIMAETIATNVLSDIFGLLTDYYQLVWFVDARWMAMCNMWYADSVKMTFRVAYVSATW